MQRRDFLTGLMAGGFAAMPCAFAQPAPNPPPGCRAWDADLPKEWQAWAESPAPLTAATAPGNVSSATMPVGKKIGLTLASSNMVHLVKDMPDIDGPRDPHSGLLALHVPADGRYWIAANGGVWIDVIVQGEIIDPSETDGGPVCASLGKALQYRLKAGDAVIQLVRARGPRIDLMVTREP